MNCTGGFILNVGNEIDDTMILQVWNSIDGWPYVHATNPMVFNTVAVQFFCWVFYIELNRILGSNTKNNLERSLKFFIYFIYFMFGIVWQIIWEIYEVTFYSIGKQAQCDVTTCTPILASFMWYGESKLNSYQDITLGSSAILFDLLFLSGACIYVWKPRTGKQIFIRLLIGFISSGLTNSTMIYYIIDLCKPNIPLTLKDGLNVFPFGIYIGLIFNLAILEYWKREDVKLDVEEEDSIRNYYNSKMIFLASAMICNSTWIVATMNAFVIHWSLMLLWFYALGDVWWYKQSKNKLL